MSDKQYPLPSEGTTGWLIYWEKQEQPWRREPEIDIERQQFLSQCLKNDGERDICPFKGIKLSRADVEWLLAELENTSEPWVSGDKSQQEEKAEFALRDAGRRFRGGEIHYRR